MMKLTNSRAWLVALAVATASPGLGCGEEETGNLDGGDAAVDHDSGQNPSDAGSETDAGIAADAGQADSGTSSLPPGTGTIELGPVALNNGVSTAVSFDLPADAVTFTVVIQGLEDNMYAVHRLDGPTGVLVDDTIPQDFLDFLLGPFPSQYKSPNRVVAQREGISAALFPNNPNVSVSGGSYSMQIAGVTVSGQQGSPASDSPNVRVLYKTGSIASGELDLNLYFTGAGDLNASNAAGDTTLTATIDKLREIYRAAGVELGVVNYYDIDPAYRTISNLSGPGNDLNEMFKLSAGKGGGLHFFFVDRIESPFGGGVIGGVAGGLPGPPGGQGTTSAGVAIALSAAMGDSALLAHVMGHEGGHWLGLSHTTEVLLPDIEDQMPDTPSGQQGTPYLMYPEGSAGIGDMLSPSQADVMRRHIETVNQ